MNEQLDPEDIRRAELFMWIVSAIAYAGVIAFVLILFCGCGKIPEHVWHNIHTFQESQKMPDTTEVNCMP